MDTKWKKGKSIVGWLCFFCSVTLAAVLLLSITNVYPFYLIAEAYQQGTLEDALCADVRDTKQFHEQLNRIFHTILSYTASNDLDDKSLQDYINDPDNLLVKTRNWVNRNRDLANTELTIDGLNPPEGYSYVLTLQQGKLALFKNGIEHSINELTFSDDYAYHVIDEFKKKNSLVLPKNYEHLNEYEISLAFREDFQFSVDTYNNNLYFIQLNHRELQKALVSYLACWTGTLLLFVAYLLLRKSKAQADRFFARATGNALLEVKILVVLSSILFLFYTNGWAEPLLPLWCCYFLLNDLRYNRWKGQKLLVHMLTKLYRRYEAKLPVQRALLLRCVLFIVLEVLLVSVTIFVLLQITLYNYYSSIYWNLSFTVFICAIALNILLIWCYFHSFRRAVNDLGGLVTQISQIHEGRYQEPITIPETSLLYPAGQELQQIQAGFASSLEEQLKAERMKVELITNVSHDIKTPLTSIISYIDLLKQEPELPDHVQSYIQILAQKSDRLKNMVQDVFDISKASSGNLALQTETLDLSTLLRQVLADMDEEVVSSTLTLKATIPDTPLWIETDGNRLYRVFQNLLKNALQYSLEHSRVYLDLAAQADLAVVTLKNTSKYEIENDGSQLLERFARGDAARTTEGSGLGLSIVQSFVKACGGSFSISVNADLFCATVALPYQESEPLLTDPVASILDVPQGNDISSRSPPQPECSPPLIHDEV